VPAILSVVVGLNLGLLDESVAKFIYSFPDRIVLDHFDQSRLVIRRKGKGDRGRHGVEFVAVNLPTYEGLPDDSNGSWPWKLPNRGSSTILY